MNGRNLALGLVGLGVAGTLLAQHGAPRRGILAERGRRLTRALRAARGSANDAAGDPVADRDPETGLSRELADFYHAIALDDDGRIEELARAFSDHFVRAVSEQWPAIARRLEKSDDYVQAFAAIRRKDDQYPPFLENWAEETANMLLGEGMADTPSFLFFDRPRIVRDGWWVHFTDHAWPIAREGFTRGIDDPRMIGLTTGFREEAKEQPGYVFSFSLDHARRYGFPHGERRPKYGREVVIFRADAVVAHHSGDEEWQAISWGPEAKDLLAASLDGKRPCVAWRDEDGEGEDVCYDDFADLVDAYVERLARRGTR